MAFLDLSDDAPTLVDAERLPAVDARRFAGMSDEEGEKEEGTEGGSGETEAGENENESSSGGVVGGIEPAPRRQLDLYDAPRDASVDSGG